MRTIVNRFINRRRRRRSPGKYRSPVICWYPHTCAETTRLRRRQREGPPAASCVCRRVPAAKRLGCDNRDDARGNRIYNQSRAPPRALLETYQTKHHTIEKPEACASHQCRSPGRRYLVDPLFGPFAPHRVAVTRRVQGAKICERPVKAPSTRSFLPHSGTTCPPS